MNENTEEKKFSDHRQHGFKSHKMGLEHDAVFVPYFRAFKHMCLKVKNQCFQSHRTSIFLHF